MLVTLTHSEMLRLWRAAAGLEPMRADCTVERVEGIDANAMIEPRMRTWYLRLLDTADPALLPTADVRDEIVLSPCREHAAATAVLPERARRLLELRLTGWLNPARPCLPPEERLRGLLARNPYCAPGAVHPVCCVAGRRLHVAPFEAGDIVDVAIAVVDEGPDSYTLDESLLSEIPDIFSHL